ncbi:2Fe-2S iron-sulfur cluster-binding protein [Candidatus Chrysopegis kryptomonas]|uniref:Ferredoxin n=1 Tax=Candidatus Chryseopegocella kryptomonas TaxID=1633643 RepID=A0A0P1P403_9BACT|nr:2Fe-2S iron-sulfur cluster-binding protein [Candidatus Chrysopegis kryptomonas]CUT05212.1 Ferredoxin [Candidatus Chrysopegis kryptomonas]
MQNGVFKIRLMPNDIIFTCKPGETILDAALRNKISLPHGCTKGGCGICKIKVVGKVDFGRVSKNRLTDEEKEKGFCLSCRAVPLEDVEISLIDGSKLDESFDYKRYFSLIFGSKTVL